ncbi:MAG: Rab family GTPase [Promethearchaeota archaeon]|jgi:small GTP-binding protein
MSDYDHIFKVLLLGDFSSGKEELYKKYISRSVHEGQKLTTGVDFCSKNYEVDGRKIKIQFWDIGGEERFRFLLSQYCKGSNRAVIMYDITDKQSLDHVPEWAQIVRESTGDIPIILVGNKLDLEESREVSREEGIKIAEQNSYSLFVEVSTNTGENIEKMLQSFVKDLIAKTA